jgi:hypothetical protein
VGFLSRILGFASRHGPAGAHFDDPDGHTIPPCRDPAVFLRALPLLFPSGAFVYFEDTTNRAFSNWLRAHSVAPPLNIAPGTIWPRPEYFHLPLRPELLNAAADLVVQERIVLPSIHLHVHDGTKMLLYWHDAFCDDPMFVASIVPAALVTRFIRALDSADGSPGPAT